MKSVAAILALVFAACASGAQKAKITPPAVEIEQEVGPAELSFPVGQTEFKYAVQVTNQWTEPITMTRIDVSTLNPSGGAYTLRRDFYSVRLTIPPGETRVTSFWAKAYSFGQGPRQAEPITLRAIVHFDTPAGTYQRIVLSELPQAGF